MKKNQKGFTLFEILFVIAIIAVGAAIAVPQLQKGIDQRKADSAITTLKTISHCLRTYYNVRDGVFPTTVAELGAAGTKCYDEGEFGKGFSFDWTPKDASGPKRITATADSTRRVVVMSDGGDPYAKGTIYDCPGNDPTACDAAVAYREMEETHLLK